MAKSLSHAALDAAFAHVADRADLLVLCDGAPAGFPDASLGVAEGGRRLASTPMAIGLGNGDYAVADGLVSGRRLVVAAQDGVSVAQDGAADHVALLDSTEGRLLMVTPLKQRVPVKAGTLIAVESFDDEIQDPD